jgi:hypothetical protein
MKCEQCSADNDTDALFCKKCGSDLKGKAIQPDAGQKTKSGRFYRFCLATVAIWTCFMLGSLLAMGFSLVNHGVIDPAAFGFGFGLGFAVLAALWFIGTVVLLLLAVATRPKISAPWPRSTQVAAVLLAVLALFWPIVKATTSSLQKPVSASTTHNGGAGTIATAGGQWQIKEDSSPMDGSKRIVISRDAENDIAGWLQSKRPTLIVRCQEGKTEAYIATGMAATVEYDTDRHTVRLRFDDRKPAMQHWDESTDHEALFAPNAVQFAREMVGSKTLTFQFTPFDASPAVARFNLEGLAPYLQKAASACGWHVAGETKTEAREPAGEGEAPTEGKAAVISSPQGAYVTVDSGTWNDDPTPVTISLAPGTHQLRIEKEGYRTQEVEVLVRTGETANVEVTLVKKDE